MFTCIYPDEHILILYSYGCSKSVLLLKTFSVVLPLPTILTLFRYFHILTYQVLKFISGLHTYIEWSTYLY